MKQASVRKYFPGILLFLVALTIGCLTYQDYGIAWDEPFQREPGMLSYEYVFNGKQDLFIKPNDYHGAGFEMLLVIIEKGGHIESARDIYLMRHLVSHIFFLFGALAGYILIYRLFRNQLLACAGFLMLVFMPRIYAHSFFNSKDIPFLAMITITMAVTELAFSKRKAWLFVLLGLAVGYTTGIRIMGIMPAAAILFFLLFDLSTDIINKAGIRKGIINMLLFIAVFCFAVYISWPYLWKQPLQTFIESYKQLSHFNWTGEVFYNGLKEQATHLSWYYMPTWFGITVPVLWMVMGIAGMAWLAIDFFKRPMQYLRNTRERNFIFVLVYIITPVAAVLILRSVIYDDWRHLYFIYPPFIIAALYFVSRLSGTFKLIAYCAIVVQFGLIGSFMIRNHPFHQVYFNELVSHKKEYLRKHYDYDYWGVSFKQALDHLTRVEQGEIKVHTDFNGSYPLDNNKMMLEEKDRQRVQEVRLQDADYFITDFRSHPEDYNFPKVEFSRQVLGSTIICVYKLKQ